MNVVALINPVIFNFGTEKCYSDWFLVFLNKSMVTMV